VPVTLTGPGSGLDDCHVDTKLSQARMTRQPLAGLIRAGLVERTRIVAATLFGNGGKIRSFS
jgi:hypothetical protein